MEIIVIAVCIVVVLVVCYFMCEHLISKKLSTIENKIVKKVKKLYDNYGSLPGEDNEDIQIKGVFPENNKNVNKNDIYVPSDNESLNELLQ